MRQDSNLDVEVFLLESRVPHESTEHYCQGGGIWSGLWAKSLCPNRWSSHRDKQLKEAALAGRRFPDHSCSPTVLVSLPRRAGAGTSLQGWLSMKGGTCQTGAVECSGVMMLLRDLVATLPCPHCTVAAVGAVHDPTKPQGCEVVVVACLHDVDVVCCCTAVLTSYAQPQQVVLIPVTLELLLLLLRKDAVKLGDVYDGGRSALHWLHAARLGFADSRKARKAWQGCGC